MKLYGVYDPKGKLLVVTEWKDAAWNFAEDWSLMSKPMLKKLGWRVVEGEFVAKETKKGTK